MKFLNKLTEKDFIEFLEIIGCKLLDCPNPILDCRNGKKEQFVLLNCKMLKPNKTDLLINELLKKTMGSFLIDKYNFCGLGLIVKEFSVCDFIKDDINFSEEYYQFMCNKFPKNYARAYKAEQRINKIKDFFKTNKEKNINEDLTK